MEFWLGVVGSVASIVSLLWELLQKGKPAAPAKDLRRRNNAVVIFSLFFFLLFSIAILQAWGAHRNIRRVEDRILAELQAGKTLTIEQLYDCVPHKDAHLVPTAVDRLESRRAIDSRRENFYLSGQYDTSYPDRLYHK